MPLHCHVVTKDSGHILAWLVSPSTHKDGHGAVKRLGFALEEGFSSVQSTAAMAAHVMGSTEHMPRAAGADGPMHRGDLAAGDAPATHSHLALIAEELTM